MIKDSIMIKDVKIELRLNLPEYYEDCIDYEKLEKKLLKNCEDAFNEFFDHDRLVYCAKIIQENK